MAVLLVILAAVAVSLAAALLARGLRAIGGNWPAWANGMFGAALAFAAIVVGLWMLQRLFVIYTDSVNAPSRHARNHAHLLFVAAFSASLLANLAMFALQEPFDLAPAMLLPVAVGLLALAGAVFYLIDRFLQIGPTLSEVIARDEWPDTGRLDLFIALSPARPNAGLETDREKWPAFDMFAGEVLETIRRGVKTDGGREPFICMDTENFRDNWTDSRVSCPYPIPRSKSPWRLQLAVIHEWIWAGHRPCACIHLVPSHETGGQAKTFLKALSLLAGPVTAHFMVDGSRARFKNGEQTEPLDDPPGRLVVVQRPIDVFEFDQVDSAIEELSQSLQIAAETLGDEHDGLIYDSTFTTSVFSSVVLRPVVNNSAQFLGYAHVGKSGKIDYRLRRISAPMIAPPRP